MTVALPVLVFPPGWQLRTEGTTLYAEHPELGQVRADPGTGYLERLAQACQDAARGR